MAYRLKAERTDTERLDILEKMTANTSYYDPLHFVRGKSGLIYGDIGGIVAREDGEPTLRGAIDALIDTWEELQD